MVHIFCSSKQLFVLSPLLGLLPYWRRYRSLPLFLYPPLPQYSSLQNLCEMRVYANTNLPAQRGLQDEDQHV